MYSSRDLVEKFIDQETMGGKRSIINDPDDPGRKTMFGLSSRYNPTISKQIMSETLTYDEAIDHYLKKYMEGLYIPELGFNLNYFIVSLVLSGQAKYLTPYLQLGLNLLGEPLIIDGDLGPKTLKAIVNVSDDRDMLIEFLLYSLDMAFSSSNDKYRAGFINRNMDNMMRILTTT